MGDHRPLCHIIGKTLVRIINELPPDPEYGELHDNFYAAPGASPRYINCDACLCIGSARSRDPGRDAADPAYEDVPKVTVRHAPTNDNCTAYHNDAGRPTFATRPGVVYDVLGRCATRWMVVGYTPYSSTRGRVALKYIGRD
jgi:hypothetical protein